MITYVGIDPSFTRTGLCVFFSSKFYFFNFSSQAGNYQPDLCLKHAEGLAFEVVNKILEYGGDKVVGIEYPIMSSKSGSILAVLMSKIDSAFNMYAGDAVRYYFPPVAIRSYTKTRTKAELVNFFNLETKFVYKVNHDEVSAYYLLKMVLDVERGVYRNKFYRM